jgi:hypothetical protein
MMRWLTDTTDKLGIDAYTLRARFQPALLVALPLALSVLALDPWHHVITKTAWTVLAWAGGTTLVAQLARDQGKLKEPKLFLDWGGKPSTVALRFRGAQNLALVQRRHDLLRRVLPDLRLPNADEERRDPRAADAAYDACVGALRDRTRDKARFPLVFEENCNYGFRRNLWGLKPWGITTSSIGSLLGARSLPQFLRIHHVLGNATDLASAGICLGLLLVWVFLVSERWVRLPAQAYTDRLFEACESLAT